MPGNIRQLVGCGEGAANQVCPSVCLSVRLSQGYALNRTLQHARERKPQERRVLLSLNEGAIPFSLLCLPRA